MKKLTNVKVTKVLKVPVELGTIHKGLVKRLEDLGIRQIGSHQTTALFKLARILRRVLGAWRDLLSLKLQGKPSDNAGVKNKTPDHDGIPGFWFKKFTSIHDRLALQMNKYLQRAHVPEWLIKGRNTLIQKDPSKRATPNNYRTITCLPMMWKILTAKIREDIYYSLISRGLFLKEQKGCLKESRGTAELP